MRMLDLIDNTAGAEASIRCEGAALESLGSVGLEVNRRGEAMRKRGTHDNVVALVLDSSRSAVVALLSSWFEGCGVASLRRRELSRLAASAAGAT